MHTKKQPPRLSTLALKRTLAGGYKRLVPSRSMRIGRWGERKATLLLQRKQHAIIRSNWRTIHGEIDIIARERRQLVIIEVKTRHISLKSHFPGIKAIDDEKRSRLHFMGRQFMRNHAPVCRRYGIKNYRVDIIELYYENLLFGIRRIISMEWHKNIPALCRRAYL